MKSNYSIEVLERKFFDLQNDLRFYQLLLKDTLRHQDSVSSQELTLKINDIQLSMVELRHGIACIRDNSYDD